MHTTTANYIELKNVYKEQHERDLSRLAELMELEEGDRKTVSDYINNLSNLEVIEMKPYSQ